jgi:hypothetical protein
MRRLAVAGRVASLALGCACLLPATAQAHGIQGRADLPVPLVAFYWAAGVVLVVSFAALALGWRRPLLAEWEARRVPVELGRGVASHLIGVVSFVLLVLVIVAALFGSTDLNDNIAPIAIFVVWWIGIALAAAFFFDIWRMMHPVAWLARRLRIPADTGTYPKWAGVWIGYVSLIAFVWLELVYPTAANVRLLGVLVVAWVVLTFVGMVRHGVAAWLEHGEGFAVDTREPSHMAIPRDGRWPNPNIGLTHMRAGRGMAAFVALLIGSVSYDGLSRTLWWKDRVARATVRLVDAGLEPRHAQLIYGTAGMLVMIALATGAFFGAAALAERVGKLPRETRWGSTADAFAPSLVPISIAYVIAHYASYFWFQSQRIVALASDPFGTGSDWFGTADFQVDYSTLSANAIWAIQLGAIVVGHVFGLAFAHDRALDIEETSPGSKGVRSQWPMLALMILYTIGGLYFLSEGLNA